MLTNNGNPEGLFRAAWMESGGVSPVGNVSKLQPNFDFIASETGCASARDVVECLRQAPPEVIKAAMDKTPTFLSFTRLLLEGKVADIPFIIGACEDEGTLFSLSSLNITTAREAASYIKTTYFPLAPETDITRLLELYPSNPALGSPFGTGNAFAFTPEFKRLAAFQGDLIFQATRRLLLNQRSGKQDARSFLNERNKITGLGATHTTELANVFGGGDMTDFLVRFANHLDPNGGPEPHWPAYNPASPQLIAFVEGSTPLAVISDTFRQEANDFLMYLGLAQPL
ncbi:hypothetical protein BN946_scf184938.g16 [Trametes cinnabarina]|uniref:Carboxylesterase type B domain-containing protein n=1 Tax=Pycnoporus cinnabarinus TaxID=5643 RepID=A0A060S797_PYCCI|nr:hypothetical protein BN946_scf184938.g16 [Trametes cinnabarina]